MFDNRILTVDDYKLSHDSREYFSLRDKVAIFSNGDKWCVIRIIDMFIYPLLYFDYTSKTMDTTYINSLVLCPYTMRLMIFKGKVIIEKYEDNTTMYLRHLDSNDVFTTTNPFIGDRVHLLRRFVKLMNLRNAFTFVSDPMYVIVKNVVNLNPILPATYTDDIFDGNQNIIYSTYHPKTIVNIVQYYSHQDHQYKHAILVGKDANRTTVSGYDYAKSGFAMYVVAYREKLEKKKAYIFPILWYMAIKIYTKAKIINL